MNLPGSETGNWRWRLEPGALTPELAARLRAATAEGRARVILEALAAALVCLDPGHGTMPAVGAQREPIGPGSRTLKIKDPGGAAGEAPVALAIARRTRALPRRPRLPRRA